MIKAVFSPLGYWRQLWHGFLDGAIELTAPDALEKYRYGWIAFEISMLSIGLFFWSALSIGVSAFSPDTWGSWACQIPALAWAGVQIACSVTVIYALMRPITYHVALIGSIFHAAQFQALALSAILSGGQVVIGIYACMFFVPAHILLAVEAYRYGRRR